MLSPDDVGTSMVCVLVSTIFEVTLSVPSLPEVPDESERLDDPSLFVTMDAVTPMPDVLLMASFSPESVLSELSSVMVCDVPLPTWIVMEPESVSLVLSIALKVPVEVCAAVSPDASVPDVPE